MKNRVGVAPPLATPTLPKRNVLLGFLNGYSKHCSADPRDRSNPSALATPKPKPSPYLSVTVVFSQVIWPVHANGDTTQVSDHVIVWPFSEGYTGFVASVLVLFVLCTRLWPKSFEKAVVSISLVFCTTFGIFFVLPDITTSNPLLLSIMFLQFNNCLFLVRGRHKVKDGHYYTMSVHYYPPIVVLTFVLAYFLSSPAMYGESTQLQWLPFTIPYLGVSVLFFSYTSFWAARVFDQTKPFLPR